MYFNEKGNTNIDSEFEDNKKFGFNLDFKKLKPILFIVGGIVLLVVIILIVMSVLDNSNKYTIELMGEERIILSVGDDYIEPGYKAYDKNNNDYTSDVEITNTVNTSEAGEYEVMYSIGKVNKVRYVVVEPKVDETYIRLNGNVNMYLEVGEKYVEPGYEAYDSVDQKLTNKVKVTGSVNTSKVGTYQLTYSVVNSRNVTTTKIRTVIVVEKGQKPKN